MIMFFSLSGNNALKKINLNIRTDDNNFILFTSLRINQEQWDDDKKRPKNIYIKSNKKLNNKLDLIKKELALFIQNRCAEKKEINQKVLSRLIGKILKYEKISLPQNSLLFFMSQYISNRKEFISHSTYKRYIVFFNLIQRFEGHVMKRLFIQDVTIEFIKKFITFGKEELYSENTIYRTIHFVKTILNFVEKKGIRTPVRELDIKREKQQKDIISLDEYEIIKIKKTKIPCKYTPSKEWLIISCYTGQRFSDFIRFSHDQLINIKGKICLKFTQQKTKKEMLIPLHPEVISIIDKNEGHFPPSLNIKQYNDDIKEIARISGINETLKTRKRIGHRTKSLIIEKWQAITSHIGRRSFATNFYGKIPTPLLIEVTGHSTEKMFLNYINPIDNERVIALSNHFDRIYNNKIEYSYI